MPDKVKNYFKDTYSDVTIYCNEGNHKPIPYTDEKGVIREMEIDLASYECVTLTVSRNGKGFPLPRIHCDDCVNVEIMDIQCYKPTPPAQPSQPNLKKFLCKNCKTTCGLPSKQSLNNCFSYYIDLQISSMTIKIRQQISRKTPNVTVTIGQPPPGCPIP